MIAGSLFNRIRRQPRLYRVLMLVVDQLPGVRSRLRGLVNRSTVPVPDLGVDDPFQAARSRGDLPPDMSPEASVNSRFLVGGYPALMEASVSGQLHLPLLLVDVSSIVRFDPRTGIQRAVRRLLQEMLAMPDAPFRVEPVYEFEGRYYFARRYAHQLLDLPLTETDRRWRPDSLVVPGAGDMFLGLDWAQPMVRSAEATLTEWRAQGVSLHFVVYDLLPLQLPQYFPRAFGLEMADWLARIARLSDSLQCISASVASEVSAYLDESGAPLPRPRVESFPLGADFRRDDRVQEQPVPELANPGDGVVTCLMVGTLDPRKGHAQALAAFERLWAEGLPVRLVIVGRPGAMNARLSRRLRSHPRSRGARPQLLWLEAASDGQLAWLYQHADFLLAASEGEGFGLPLIEAGLHGLPVLARDLPVFREVLGEGAEYFAGLQADDLAEAVVRYLGELQGGQPRLADTSGMCSWQQSAEELVSRLVVFLRSEN